MRSQLLLQSFIAAATGLLSLGSAACALKRYQSLRALQTWAYNDILQARDDPAWSFYQPVAIVAWLAAAALSVANLILFLVARGKGNWMLPATGILLVSASGVFLLFVLLQ